MKKVVGVFFTLILAVIITSCKPKEYTIKFYDHDNKIIEKINLEKGQPIKAPSDLFKDGYTFVGWDQEFEFAERDMSIRPVFEVNVYQVVFIDYDGEIIETRDINHNGSLIIENPVREGYKFIGWSKDLIKIKSDLIVTAMYEIHTYEINILNYDNTILIKYEVEHGSSLTIDLLPERDGHKFVGWDRETKEVKSDMTIKPIFKKNQYNVILLTENEQNVMNFQIFHGDVIKRPKLEGEGIYFEIEWTEGDNVYDFTSMVEGDLTLVGIKKFLKINIDFILDENIKKISFENFITEINILLKIKNGYKIDLINSSNGDITIENEIITINNFDIFKKISVNIKTKSISNLPTINIDTGGNPVVSKEDYIDGQFEMYNSKGFDVEASKMEVRGRGNSTWAQPKKPLRIKFDKKISMFGSIYEQKNWVLLADYLDITHSKNYFAYNLAQNLVDEHEGMLFAPIGKNVNVYFNDVYQGIFLFADHKDYRRMDLEIEVDETMDEFPFYLEMDEYAQVLEDENKISQIIGGIERHFDIKYPSPKDRLESNPSLQYNYIKEYLNNTEESIRTRKNYDEYIDVKSFIDFYLINQLMENHEISAKSVHMTKRNGEKLRLGPVWDFDWSVGGPIFSFENHDPNLPVTSSDYWSGDSTTWWASLIKDEKFQSQVKERWSIISELIDMMLTEMKTYKNIIRDDVQRDMILWDRYQETNNSLLTFDGQFDYFTERLKLRQSWISSEVLKYI